MSVTSNKGGRGITNRQSNHHRRGIYRRVTKKTTEEQHWNKIKKKVLIRKEHHGPKDQQYRSPSTGRRLTTTSTLALATAELQPSPCRRKPHRKPPSHKSTGEMKALRVRPGHRTKRTHASAPLRHLCMRNPHRNRPPNNGVCPMF